MTSYSRREFIFLWAYVGKKFRAEVLRRDPFVPCTPYDLRHENAEAENVGFFGEIPIHHVLWGHVSSVIGSTKNTRIINLYLLRKKQKPVQTLPRMVQTLPRFKTADRSLKTRGPITCEFKKRL